MRGRLGVIVEVGLFISYIIISSILIRGDARHRYQSGCSPVNAAMLPLNRKQGKA